MSLSIEKVSVLARRSESRLFDYPMCNLVVSSVPICVHACKQRDPFQLKIPLLITLSGLCRTLCFRIVSGYGYMWTYTTELYTTEGA